MENGGQTHKGPQAGNRSRTAGLPMNFETRDGGQSMIARGSVSLPMLEGLLSSLDGTETTKIFEQALREEHHYHIIQRSLRLWVHRQRQIWKRNPSKCRSDAVSSNEFDRSTARPHKRQRCSSRREISREMKGDRCDFPRAPQLHTLSTVNHWWWKSLTSYVDAERSAAVHFLVRACKTAHDRFLLVRPFLLLLELLVSRITGHPLESVSPLDVPVSRRFIRELIGLLDHVMSSTDEVLVAQHRWYVLDRVANHVMDLALFIGSSGMLSTTLMSQDCLRGLLNLLHKWLLVDHKCAHDENNKHLHIWFSTESPSKRDHPDLASWCPLASLMTAFAATKARMNWLESSKEQSGHALLLSLHTLLDLESRRVPQTKGSDLFSMSAPPASTHSKKLQKSLSSTSAIPCGGNSTSTEVAYASRQDPSPPSPNGSQPQSNLSDDDDEEEEEDDDDDDIGLEEEDDDDDDVEEDDHDEGDDRDAGEDEGSVKDEKCLDLSHLISESVELEAQREEEDVTGGYFHAEGCKDSELHSASSDDEEDFCNDDVEDDDCEIGEILSPRGEDELDNGVRAEEEEDDDDTYADDDDEESENMETDYQPLFSPHGRTCGFSSPGESSNALNSQVSNINRNMKMSDELQGNRKVHKTELKNVPLVPILNERRRAFVQAAMFALSAVHGSNRRNKFVFSMDAENCLLEIVNEVIQPPKKPITTKIIMRRAPTQEEFFRGTLSKNPISIDAIQPSVGDEPTVGDLRQYIANDLHMADSAELIEILVANKIVDVGLRLRLVHHVLWKRHLIENSTSNSSSSFLSMGSGMSLIFSHGRSSGIASNAGISEHTPSSHLPPMIATYRKCIF